MCTINFVECKDFSRIANCYERWNWKLFVENPKYSLFRAVVDSVITYVWDGILLATCGTRFTVLYMLLRLKQWNAPVVKLLKIKVSQSWRKQPAQVSVTQKIRRSIGIKFESCTRNLLIKRTSTEMIIRRNTIIIKERVIDIFPH